MTESFYTFKNIIRSLDTFGRLENIKLSSNRYSK